MTGDSPLSILLLLWGGQGVEAELCNLTAHTLKHGKQIRANGTLVPAWNAALVGTERSGVMTTRADISRLFSSFGHAC